MLSPAVALLVLVRGGRGRGLFLFGTRLLLRERVLSWALADQVMVSGSNFLMTVFLARYLGLEEFGRFALAWMAVLFAAGIHYALVAAPMMSIGPKQIEADRPAYFGAVLFHALPLSLDLKSTRLTSR